MRFPKMDAAIAAYMRENNMTQAQFASMLGMTENTLSWKRRGYKNREFSLGEAAKVACILGTSLDHLVIGAEA